MAAVKTSPAADALDLPILHSVSRARAGRKLALALGLMIVALPVAAAFVPWQQNVAGTGRVVALDPRQRPIVIPAPVTGVLVDLQVQEGSRVEEGATLAVMSDQDTGLLPRLEARLEFAQQKVASAELYLKLAQEKAKQLRAEKDLALTAARADVRIAFERIKQAEQDVVAKEANVKQKEADLERQRKLYEEVGTRSQDDFQLAELAYATAKAELEAARAKEKEAISDEEAKIAAQDRVSPAFDGRIADAEAAVQSAQQSLQDAQTDLTNKESELRRQETQVVKAPMAGTVLAINGANNRDLISRGAPLIEFVPDADDLVVELLMRGIDAPLIKPGRKARLQFEGWPAVQFAGWPSVAVGTFGGVVRLVDAQARPDGRVRVVVVPDPEDEEWPDPPFLRQNVRASGWIQLEMVSAGYEIWRQLNAFPPTVAMEPQTDAQGLKGDGKFPGESGDAKKP